MEVSESVFGAEVLLAAPYPNPIFPARTSSSLIGQAGLGIDILLRCRSVSILLYAGTNEGAVFSDPGMELCGGRSRAEHKLLRRSILAKVGSNPSLEGYLPPQSQRSSINYIRPYSLTETKVKKKRNPPKRRR